MSANINETEVNKFSSRAEEWWKNDGDFKTLHEINPVRLAYIESRINIPAKSVLDIGCGGGILSEAMAAKNAIVTGIDAGQKNIDCANQHAATNGLSIDYQCITAEEFAQKHQSQFDLITCMELLEHVPNPESLISACAKMIKPGGHVIFSTINRHPKSYLFAILAAEYVLNLLPKGTHDYQQFIRPAELAAWCHTTGLTVKDIQGMQYNPFLNQCNLSEKPDVNYLMDSVLD
ncbi:MAG: bifunctional 2-polyprenyl-6-hydroxyphenol methylase/3-demethylubiquinol 3-O-methyltransferase UbiG [Pseudomonadota bacterium]